MRKPRIVGFPADYHQEQADDHADEDAVDAGGFFELGRRVVVAGQHRDFLAVLLHFLERGNRVFHDFVPSFSCGEAMVKDGRPDWRRFSVPI